MVSSADSLVDASLNPSKKKSMRSTLVSRNVTIAKHRTSVRLEPDMWSGLAEICRRERTILHEICTAVAARKSENTSLTAAIRVFVMAYFRSAATEDGHIKAGHGYGIGSRHGASIGMARPAPSQNPVGNSAYALASGKISGTQRF